jgi:SHS2 domain-containing protein
MQSLLYNFLDELLFVFATEFLVCRELTVTRLDRREFKITASG